ncbi:hypothetical protein DEU56DRAFT_752863 [Suillus clintonianus]|uniref:uncharacterized protein n=1 Tax=Suillus clintonianus TaxID=1904413 RepID=UPI001B87E29A|nr:uncharacterized protein DEU56DRAFT_752863 [Suillus clintonianus]KAG2149209.1 hypothetical protein DEU56DRAFT_752863 [Suillus clintonianus]
MNPGGLQGDKSGRLFKEESGRCSGGAQYTRRIGALVRRTWGTETDRCKDGKTGSPRGQKDRKSEGTEARGNYYEFTRYYILWTCATGTELAEIRVNKRDIRKGLTDRRKENNTGTETEMKYQMDPGIGGVRTRGLYKWGNRIGAGPEMNCQADHGKWGRR